MKNLKDYRDKELPLYIIANILVFLIVHQFISIDASDVPNTVVILSQLFISTVLSAIAFSFILVVECLFTSNFKDKLLFLFGLFKMPGSTIFTRIKNNNRDRRFSYQSVKEKHPDIYDNLPIEKKTKQQYENEKWYAIYSQHRDISMIHNSQRDWLLYRDIYISTLVMIILYIITTVIRFVEFNFLYLLFLLIMAIVINFGANRKAARFAYNVIAYDASKFQKKE